MPKHPNSAAGGAFPTADTKTRKSRKGKRPEPTQGPPAPDPQIVALVQALAKQAAREDHQLEVEARRSREAKP